MKVDIIYTDINNNHHGAGYNYYGACVIDNHCKDILKLTKITFKQNNTTKIKQIYTNANSYVTLRC